MAYDLRSWKLGCEQDLLDILRDTTPEEQAEKDRLAEAYIDYSGLKRWLEGHRTK